ncbi:hypothetical protein LTR95_010558 [Oleoguttula sp. CCFEE 5521]
MISRQGLSSALQQPQEMSSAGASHCVPIGASATTTFELMRRDISYWDIISQDWVIGTSTIGVFAGFSSRDIRATGSFTPLIGSGSGGSGGGYGNGTASATASATVSASGSATGSATGSGTASASATASGYRWGNGWNHHYGGDQKGPWGNAHHWGPSKH